MKHKNLIIGFALALGTLGAIGVGTAVGSIGTPNEVEAYNQGDVYEIVGALANYSDVNWTPGGSRKITKSEMRGEQKWFYDDLLLEDGDTFKIVNGSNTANPWDIKQSLSEDDKTNFTIQGGGNFEVLVGGYYRISFLETLENDNNYLNGYSFAKLADDVPYYDVTLIGPDETTIKTEETSGITVYNVNWFKVDGYVNHGWYTDAELKTEYVPSVPTADFTLYGKWETAPADLIVYYEGDFTHAYIYSSDATYKNNTWPGVAMEKLDRAWGTNVYKFVVEGEYEANMIIFNNGGQGQQSADIALVSETAVYNGWQEGDDKKGQVAADSDDKLAALDFITEFDTLRKDGSICYLVNETGNEDALNSIITKYEAIENKALVDGLTDIGAEEGVTIGLTMAMLLSHKNGTSGVYGVYSTDPYNTTWIVLLALAGTSVLLGGAFFALKRKKARK